MGGGFAFFSFPPVSLYWGSPRGLLPSDCTSLPRFPLNGWNAETGRGWPSSSAFPVLHCLFLSAFYSKGTRPSPLLLTLMWLLCCLRVAWVDFPAQDASARSLSHEANDTTAWLQLGLDQGASLMAPWLRSLYHGFLWWHIAHGGLSAEQWLNSDHSGLY